MIMPHHKLRIHKNIAGEYQRSHNAVAQLDLGVVREEGSHEAKQDQHPQAAEEIRHPTREVVLGLAGKQRQSQEDAHGEYEGLEHDLALVEARDDGDGVGLQAGEASEEDQVRRVGFALPEGEEHEADGAEERDPHHPLVRLDPFAVGVGEEGDGGEGGGEDELDGEDGVDFAHEHHPHRQRGFGDAAAEFEVVRDIVVFCSRLAGHWLLLLLVAGWRLGVVGLLIMV